MNLAQSTHQHAEICQGEQLKKGDDQMMRVGCSSQGLCIWGVLLPTGSRGLDEVHSRSQQGDLEHVLQHARDGNMFERRG